MAFIMPASRKPEALIYLLLFSATLLGVYTVARADAIDVDQAEIRIVNGLYLLEARLQYKLTEEAVEALSHGVPLNFKVQLNIAEERSYMWDRDLLSSRHDYRLEYHALSEQYLVTNMVTGDRHIFLTLSGAVGHLGKVSMALGDLATLINHEDAYAELSAELDIEALPAPLRPIAYFSPDWHINSPVERVALPE